MSKYLARLHPYDPAVKPPMMQDYTAAPWKIKFKNGVWYEVPEAAAGYLRTVRQAYDDPNSPLAFDVCTEVEAEAIMLHEEAASLGIVHDSKGQPPPLMPDLEEEAPAKSPELNQPRPRHELSAAAAANAAATRAAAVKPKVAAPKAKGKAKSKSKKRTRSGG